MFKKSLIFGSAALFLAALITLTGCPTSVDDGSTSGMNAHRIYGTAVSPYQAQEAIDRAVAVGEPIVLEDRLTIVAPATGGHLNFKNARVIINGAVTFDNGVVSVADAAVEWANNGRLDLGTGGSYIYRKGMDTSKIAHPDTLVEYVDSLNAIQSTAVKVGVKQFKLGPIQDFDYSTGEGVDPLAKGTHLATIFVLDELIIPSEGRVPSLEITALGTVDVTGVLPATVVVGGGTLPLGTCSTLTSSRGSMNIPVPGTATIISNIDVQEGRHFAITQTAAGSLTIAGKLTGKGTLEVRGPVTNITVNGGDGSLWFSGAAAPTKCEIASTGTVTFDHDVTALAGAPSSIAGDAVFKGNVKTTNDLALLGNVTLASDKKIDLSFVDVSGSVTANYLMLGPNKTVSLAIPTGVSTTYAPILVTGPSGTALIGLLSTGAVLTAAPAPAKNDAAQIAAAKKLTLGTRGLIIRDGTLQVVPGAALELDGVTLKTNSANKASGFLALADSGKLIFTGSGALDLGKTTINTASTLTAVGGLITLGSNTIEGNEPGTKLEAPAKGGTAGTAPKFTVSTDTYLTLKQVDLNLAAFGGLEIAAVTSNHGGVILKDRAKIILNNGEGGQPATGTKITTSAGTLALGGDYEALTAPNAAANKEPVWSVAQNGVGEASVIAGAATVTLGKTPAAAFTK
jgi:hypothetical protein